jgi:hypothetical protein
VILCIPKACQIFSVDYDPENFLASGFCSLMANKRNLIEWNKLCFFSVPVNSDKKFMHICIIQNINISWNINTATELCTSLFLIWRHVLMHSCHFGIEVPLIHSLCRINLCCLWSIHVTHQEVTCVFLL